MSNPAPDAGHKWNTDRPGELPEHDELDRKIFSQRVAKELRAWRKKDSLVVSLNGYWGSGKTTLANLIFYYVREQAKEEGEKQPVVVRFEPWQWSGQDLLVEAFFGKISDALGREDVGEKAGRLKAGWRKLGTLLGVGRLVVKWVGRAAEGAAAGSVAAGNAGVAVAAVSTKAIVSAVEEGLEGVQQAADAGAAAHAAAEESAATSIEAVRGELKALLMDLDAPLIVVIDDIDRLTTEQVRMLVQLVKANADFPNVVYLLLYQKSVVAKALETSICEAGQDFLKKIVQVELEVPSPPDRKLREMFGRGLERILITAETRWDRERWRTLFDEAVWPFFRTPRDIKRFLSVFEFYFDGHVTDGVLEVNPIDLVLIETLRMFDPTAYEEVSRAFQRQRNLLLEVLYDDKEAKNQFVIGVKNLVERDELGATERRRLRALLVALFPYAQESFSHSDGREQEWLRDLRICHEKHFPRYFQLGGDPGDITAAFMAKLFKAGNDRARLRDLLKEAFDSGTFETLMDRLRAVRDDVPAGMIEPLSTALFDLSDELPEMKATWFFSADAERELVRIVAMLLNQIEGASDRAATLRQAALASTAVTGPVLCVDFFQPNAEEKQATRQLPIDLVSLKAIQSELTPRLWATARAGQLWKLRAVAALIWRLRNWAGLEEVRKWLTSELQQPEAATAFLRAMLRESQVSGGRKSRTVYTLSGTQLEEFIDLEMLAVSAEKAANEVLEKAAVEKLRTALELKKQGKPYAEIYVLSRNADGNFYTDASDSRF